MQNQLIHYGKLGMHWGRRSGKTPEQKHTERKTKILNNPKLLAKHHHELTEQEVQHAIKRIKLDIELSNLSIQHKERGMNKVKSIMAIAGTIGTAGVAIGKAVKSPGGQRAIKLIKDAIQKLSNSPIAV